MRSPKERTDGRAARCVAMRPNSTSATPPLAAFFTNSRSASFTDCTWAAAGPVRAISATATKLMMVSAFMQVPPRGEGSPQDECHRGAVQWPGPTRPKESTRAREPTQDHVEAWRNGRQRLAGYSHRVHSRGHGASGFRLPDR